MKKLILFFVLISSFCYTQTEDYKQLDSFLDTLSENTKVMASMSILKKGELVYDKSVGYQFITSEEKRKATSQSKYRIGSITKTFTAVMIFELIDEEKITLNDKLSKYFPEIKNAANIKISNMLNHSSGLYNITNADDFGVWMLNPSTQKEMLSRLEKYDVDFQAGEQTAYSNTNYILLGYILEQIEKKSYSVLLKERIIDKIGLKNTYAGGIIDINDNECKSYNYENESWKVTPETHMSNPGGAGAIISNPTDLALFITELFNDKLMSKESLKLMTTASDKDFCSGIFYSEIDGLVIYGSEGGIDGFQSMLVYIPSTETAIALTANALNYSKMKIMMNALSVSHGKEIKMPNMAKIKLTEEEVKQYEGIYESNEVPFDLVFEAHGAILKGAPEQSNLKELIATKKDEFRFDELDVVLEFNTGEKTVLFTRGENPSILFNKK